MADDVKGRSKAEFIPDLFQEVLGPAPSMDVRRYLLAFPAGFCLIVFTVLVVGGVLLGALVSVLGAHGVGGVILFTGQVLAAPFGGLGFVWAYRWFMNDRDYSAWVRAGRPEGWVPRASSQPGDRDFLLGLPWTAMFLWWFIGSILAP